MNANDLRTAREAANHTQASLAKALGVTPRTIRYWEAAERAIPPLAVLAIPAALTAPAPSQTRPGRPPKPEWPKPVTPENHPRLYNWSRIGRRKVAHRGKAHPGYSEPSPGHYWLEVSPGQFERSEKRVSVYK